MTIIISNFYFHQGLEKLVELRSNNDATIIAAAISPDGKAFVYSTIDEIRIFHLNWEVSASIPHPTTT